MKNYYCEYVRDENEANIVNFTWNLEIAADSSREAYELFLEKTDNLPFKIIVKEIYYNDYLAAEAFDGHIDSARTVEEIVAVNKLKDEQKLRKSAKNYEDELSGFSEGGYLLLSVEDKIKFQKVYESYAEIMQRRGLYSEEVDFVKLWVEFKDRELGQNMVDVGIFDSISFSDHLKEDFEKEKVKSERALEAKSISNARAEAERFHSLLSEALKEIETKSYFELEVEDRIICSGYFNSLIATFEKRGLLPIEIKFIKGWQKLKDRELGESLLAKNEMAKPKAQQGKSPLGNMLMAGMAISTMKLSQDIGEVSDQVENISEGFGFEG